MSGEILIELYGCGGGFSFACEDFGRLLAHSILASVFFLKVAISSRTLIPHFIARISPQWLSELR